MDVEQIVKIVEEEVAKRYPDAGRTESIGAFVPLTHLPRILEVQRQFISRQQKGLSVVVSAILEAAVTTSPIEFTAALTQLIYLQRSAPLEYANQMAEVVQKYGEVGEDNGATTH